MKKSKERKEKAKTTPQVELVKKIETGIEGLDEVLGGGLPIESLNLVSGTCGTGKSTLALQFLYHGAKFRDEPGVYITMEEEPEELIERAKAFGWDLEELIAQKKLRIVKPEMYRFEVLKRTIEDEVENIQAKRIVINPFTFITAYFEKTYDVRKALAEIKRELKRFDCTALAISDIREGEESFSASGYEEFIADGVIVLKIVSKKETASSFTRAIFIRKMRTSPHPLKMIPMEIGKKGIELYPDAEVF